MKKVMGMLSLEHYCRAIWDGREREKERVFESTQLRQREGKSGRQNGLVMGFRVWVSIILGPCNYRSIDDKSFST